MSPTVLHRLADWAKATPNAPAQRFKSGGEWKTISASEYMERVFALAAYLESRGVTGKQTGAILSYNCAEWVHLELALMLVGAKFAGLYPNSTPKDIQYILGHTEAVCLGVQNKDYFNKITTGGNTLPARIQFVIAFDGDTSFSPKAVAYAAAVAEGKKLIAGRKVEDYLGKLIATDPAFLIYTSGTTGNPKGAILTHDNLAFTSDVVAREWKLKYIDGSLFSFLPLCHIAEQLHSVGVGITQRYLVNYCTKFENVSTELPETEPSLLLCVPRVWEKMMEAVVSKIEKSKGVKKHLATWALAVGARMAKAKFSGQEASRADQLQYRLADKLVLSKVRKAMGLARGEILASGAAPLPAHVSRWFRSLGLEILECYGLTESTGMICITIRGKDCAGTVGRPLDDCEFRLGSDGEIQSRGRNIFLGYFNDPVNTSATLQDGWLHTGDLGEWTEAKYIRIVGRKKDIMKSSGGKMVAPVPIEEKLKEHHLISQVCLVGDNRKYFSAIITLTETALADLKSNTSAFSEGSLKDPVTLKKVTEIVELTNKSLASFEQIKRFTVLDREFSIESGEMTPTLKMKRNVIESQLKPVIDSMYA